MLRRAVKVPLQGTSLLALRRLYRLMRHLRLQLKRDRLLHAISRLQYFLIGRKLRHAGPLVLLSLLLRRILRHWQLSFAAQWAIYLCISWLLVDLVIVKKLLLLHNHWIHHILVHERGRRIWRTVEKRLSVDSSPLLELLFHLIGNHLLTESDLAQVHWTVIVFLLASMRGVSSASSRLLAVVVVLGGVFFFNIVDEAALVVLALQGASQVVTCSPPRVIFGTRLTHLLHVLLRLTSARCGQKLLHLFTFLHWMVKKVLV